MSSYDRNLKLRFFLVFLFQVFGINTYAQNTPIIDAEVIVCKNSNKSIISVELYDFYEAKTLRGTYPDLGDSKLNPVDKAMIAINRLEKYSPARADNYREKARVFLDQTNFIKGVDLGVPTNLGKVIVPEGCALERIAIEREPLRESDKRYTVNSTLWSKLNSDDKAGVITHLFVNKEVMGLSELHWTRSDQLKDSLLASYLNSIYTSKIMKSISMGDFINILRKSNFKITDVDGVLIKTDEDRIKLNEKGELAEGFALSGNVFVNRIKIALDRECPVEFYPSNKVKTFYPNDGLLYFTVANENKIRFFSFDEDDRRDSVKRVGYVQRYCQGEGSTITYPIEIHLNGNLKSARLSNEETFHSGRSVVSMEGQYTYYSSTYVPTVEFNDDGTIGGGVLRAEATVETQDGRMIKLPKGTKFKLDSNGRLL